MKILFKLISSIVRVDDNVVRHLPNESTYTIRIDQHQQPSTDKSTDNSGVYYDVTLTEINEPLTDEIA